MRKFLVFFLLCPMCFGLDTRNRTDFSPGGLWTASGSDIYFIGGSVGIGTTSPQATLDIVGDLRLDGTPVPSMYLDSDNEEVTIAGGTSTINAPRFVMHGGSRGSLPGDIFLTAGNGTGTQAIRFEFDEGATNEEKMCLLSTGELGIGIDVPEDQLHISVGSTNFRGLRISGTADNFGFELDNNAASGREYRVHSVGGGSGNGPGNFVIEDSTASVARMVIDPDGDVGIGTVSPDFCLTIDGVSAKNETLKVTNDKTDFGPQISIDSDGASGREWKMVSTQSSDPSGAGNLLFYNATDLRAEMVFDVSRNFGLRTTSPQGNLQISSEDTHGGYVYKIYSASSGTLTGATDTIELNIPANRRILQVQVHVKTAVTDDGGDDTWSSELNDGAQVEVISAGSAAAQNTNINHWAVVSTWGTLTDAETDILLTPNAGNFTGGVIEATALCLEFDTWDNE